MAKITKIEDKAGHMMPLRVTHCKASKKKIPHLRVKCGCCNQAFEIYFDNPITENPHIDILEIGGVCGNIAQWRELLLPLLQIASEK